MLIDEMKFDACTGGTDRVKREEKGEERKMRREKER